MDKDLKKIINHLFVFSIIASILFFIIFYIFFKDYIDFVRAYAIGSFTIVIYVLMIAITLENIVSLSPEQATIKMRRNAALRYGFLLLVFIIAYIRDINIYGLASGLIITRTYMIIYYYKKA